MERGIFLPHLCFKMRYNMGIGWLSFSPCSDRYPDIIYLVNYSCSIVCVCSGSLAWGHSNVIVSNVHSWFAFHKSEKHICASVCRIVHFAFEQTNKYKGSSDQLSETSHYRQVGLFHAVPFLIQISGTQLTIPESGNCFLTRLSAFSFQSWQRREPLNSVGFDAIWLLCRPLCHSDPVLCGWPITPCVV